MWGFGGDRRRLAMSVSLVALLSACAVKPEPLQPADLARQAAEDRQAMFATEPAPAAPLTMADAIARALKYNLDKRAKMMEEALALGQTDLDKFELLPHVAAQAGYAGRNVPYIARSTDVVTGLPSNANPTVSQDRDRRVGDLSISWNILDFGVSYYTAHQDADRALIAGERRRKTVNILVQEVRYAFWRAAAYQVLKPSVERAVTEAREALETSRTVEQENLKAPAEALRYQKTLLETLRQLTSIEEELSTAQIQLAALINLPPGSEITLAVPDQMPTPQVTMPIEKMEEVAFLNNPDLHEQAYLARIAVDDTRKAILRILPGISLSASGRYDSNSYLVDKRWYETGAMMSWNLINLVSAPAQIDFAETNEEVAQARRLALRMAVLAQVHLAERQFHNAESQYHQAGDLWVVDSKLAKLSKDRASNDAQGVLERVWNDTSAITSHLRLFQTYAQVQDAYAKILSTLGEDVIPPETTNGDLSSLSQAISSRLENGDGHKPDPAAAGPQTDQDAGKEDGRGVGDRSVDYLEHLYRAYLRPLFSAVSDTSRGAA
ncbi:TolC family protein [Telmatospirillum siberiense]|uniref:TolC family protein n=1 Tax=Telmatospirillum siberiense TaxID=382514 RepID=A0A2N3PZV6_9PROT|nr:TolC family protein [Telmatospirillum siberiense]PKU25947.1 TolC family protein [Telmatospirillum siberiense]